MGHKFCKPRKPLLRYLPFATISALILLLGLAWPLAAQEQGVLAAASATGSGNLPGRFAPRLTASERQARPDLAILEDAALDLLAKIKAQDERLAKAKADSLSVLGQHAALASQDQTARIRLRNLLSDLWAVSVTLKAGMDASIAPWGEADRRLTWLGAAYGAAREELTKEKEASAELAQNLSQQEQMRAQISEIFEQLEATKDSLFEAELNLLNEMTALRRDQASGRQALDRVLALLGEMNFQGQPFTGQAQDKTQETPIWPVEGRLLADFAPQDSPRPGLWLGAGQSGKVLAALGGKVVYNDGIRGLGRVVILSHGQQARHGLRQPGEISLEARPASGRGRAFGAGGSISLGARPSPLFRIAFS